MNTYNSEKLAAESGFPAFKDLAEIENFPDVLKMLDGTIVNSQDQWQKRRDELGKLFQHYMYGYFPPLPEISAKELFRNSEYLSGAATVKEIQLTLNTEPQFKINILMAMPNNCGEKKPAVFVGPNFAGNKSILHEEHIAESNNEVPHWILQRHADAIAEGKRGYRSKCWPVEDIVARGYALASFYHGDIAPDDPQTENSVHKCFQASGEETKKLPHRFGTIAAWAWAIMCIVEYLQTDNDIDPKHIISVGHSRNGKTALLAAAFDERIAMAIPHQSGCCGAAPSRSTTGERLSDITRLFPHWFCENLNNFAANEARLPFDQHCLLAMCAPRPVLCTNAREDEWANPQGQFDMLTKAAPSYKLLGSSQPAAEKMPPLCELVDSPLGYWIRPGKHMMNLDDWKIFMDFADKHLG